MQLLICDIDNKCNQTCTKSKCKTCNGISVDEVSQNIKHMTYGVENTTSDVIIHSCHNLKIHISMMFTMMLKHGNCPRNMSISTLVHIPKDKKISYNDSDNDRSIALVNNLCKLNYKIAYSCVNMVMYFKLMTYSLDLKPNI